MTQAIQTLEEFNAEAARFARGLNSSAEGATLVTLAGELGAGKTAFVKAVAKVFGVEAVVNSPTFVLEKIYELGSEASKFERLIHIDAYRLEKGSDLSPLGFDELMEDSGNLIMLEWPERVAGALPPPTVAITLVASADGSRTISYA